MIRSFRILAGTVKQYVIIFSALIGGIAAAGAVNKLVRVDWLNGFLNNAVRLIASMAMAVFLIVVLLGVYNMNSPEATGYKYYHSLPNSAELFKDAVIFANVGAVVITAACAVLLAVFFEVGNALFAAAVSLFGVGIMNFLGHLKSLFAKMLSLVLVGCTGGFSMGFADGAEIEVSLWVYAVIAAVSAAVYIAGTVFAAVRAKTVWEREA